MNSRLHIYFVTYKLLTIQRSKAFKAIFIFYLKQSSASLSFDHISNVCASLGFVHISNVCVSLHLTDSRDIVHVCVPCG